MLSRRPWQTWAVLDDRLQRLADARLYLVCGELPEMRLDAALRGGVQVVQLRMKAAEPARVVEVGRRFRSLCEGHGVPLLINDHPELVEPAGADGVHLGQDDMAVAEARELLGPERIIGLSTHDEHQIREAGAAGADYIGVGPVYATPTKPGRPGVGTDLIARARSVAVQPFFAIGGIHPGNVAAVRAAGAERVAVVRAITEAEDPARAAGALRAALESGVGVGAT